MLNPERHEDRYLLRFLRARTWDNAKAEAMFRDTLAFRAKWKLDTIIEEYKPPQVERGQRDLRVRGEARVGMNATDREKGRRGDASGRVGRGGHSTWWTTSRGAR